MKLKIQLGPKPQNKEANTCLDWSSTEEVYSAGDNGELLSWSVSRNISTKVATLPKDFYPIDMHFLSSKATSSVSKHSDIILITCANGKFHILNRNGRIERSVEAHKGAVLVGQWGRDATSILTGGEDGCIKIWSRSGMLRSTLVTSDNSVYGACWSPDNLSVAYTQGKSIVIKELAPNTKPLKWKAHDGLVVALAWSHASQLLVSGSEDCRYRIWNPEGHLIYSSGLHDHHITAVQWSPDGQLFAIGSYNTLRLCDYAGWSRCLEKPISGTIYKISWSGDGTQLAAACANGHIIFSHVIERRSTYMEYTATLTEKKVITIRTILDDTVEEQLELPERVIQFEMKYNHLVVTTPDQCYIYSNANWNTPSIFDLKDGSVILLLLTEKLILLVEKTSVGLYSYHGKLVGSPRWPNMRLDTIRSEQISMAMDFLAIRDAVDSKVVNLIEIGSNRSSTESNHTTLSHTNEISEIALNQWSCPTLIRYLAILDKMKDLYLIGITRTNTTKKFTKLGRKTESFKWNTEENMIAAIQDNQLIVWYCPQAAFDAALLKLCTMVYEGEDLGRSPKVHDFVRNSVSIRRADGGLINIPVSPLPSILYKHLQGNHWTYAIDFCRSAKDRILWSSLACMATLAGTEAMDIAQEAYAKIDHFTKVAYIQNVKLISSKTLQKARMVLLSGAIQEAESILLNGSMIFQAIYMHIRLYNWSRALELANKYRNSIDCVLFMRKKYLESLDQEETNSDFISLNQSILVDEEKVTERIHNETRKAKI